MSFSDVMISINYEDAMRQARKLKTAANECEDAERAANNAYSQVCESWSGEAADAFKMKLEEWKRENSRLKEDIREVAELIEIVARRIKEADEALANAMQG